MTQLPDNLHITYQLQYRKCGKSSCSTCRTGSGHGPYWYAYWREGSRLRSGYIGKVHPDEEARADLTAQLSEDLLLANALFAVPTPTMPPAREIARPRKVAARSRTAAKVKEPVLSS
jgi:hypothetical protein